VERSTPLSILFRTFGRIVQQLPELETFLTIKEVGEKDSLDWSPSPQPSNFNLSSTSISGKGSIGSREGPSLDEILLESEEKKITQFIHCHRSRIMALLLKKFLHVTTWRRTFGRNGTNPPFTLDQFTTFILRKEDQGGFWTFFKNPLSHRWRRLSENDGSLVCEFESELEETGYRYEMAFEWLWFLI